MHITLFIPQFYSSFHWLFIPQLAGCVYFSPMNVSNTDTAYPFGNNGSLLRPKKISTDYRIKI